MRRRQFFPPVLCVPVPGYKKRKRKAERRATADQKAYKGERHMRPAHNAPRSPPRRAFSLPALVLLVSVVSARGVSGTGASSSLPARRKMNSCAAGRYLTTIQETVRM